MKQIFKTLIWLTVFSIAMGYLETSVVVYLRKLFYSGGFKFPLNPVSREIAITEFWREVATIIMLIGAGVLAGKNGTQRFGFFIYCFAIWDIFYYVFLKVLINWPDSLSSWDILFLIPVPWVGPVIAPCIVSLTMIYLTLIIVYFNSKGIYFNIKWKEWLIFISGSCIIITSFMWDYILFAWQSRNNPVEWTLTNHKDLFGTMNTYMPEHFNWWLFGTGEGLIILTIIFIFKRVSGIKQ